MQKFNSNYSKDPAKTNSRAIYFRKTNVNFSSSDQSERKLSSYFLIFCSRRFILFLCYTFFACFFFLSQLSSKLRDIRYQENICDKCCDICASVLRNYQVILQAPSFILFSLYSKSLLRESELTKQREFVK